jgi:hypothetical protein
MRAVVVAALLALPACQEPLDACAKNHTCQMTADSGSGSGQPMCSNASSMACMDATTHMDLTWIQTNVFNVQCTFSGCHNGAATPAGMVDMRSGMAYSHLVNFTSVLEPSRKLIVPGDPKSSYLEVMLGIINPADATPPTTPPRADVGYMPQSNGGALLCCQKLMAIDRWISAGAMNN